jgi:hypothetical protein
LNLTVNSKPADAVTTQTICSESLLEWYWLYQLKQESFKTDVLLIKYWTWLDA